MSGVLVDREALEGLRAMIARDMPSTADLLPNRAGHALRKQAHMLRGYLEALDAALALPAQAAADAAGVQVINPERGPEGITPGMREAAERIARSVVGDPHGLQRSTTTRQVGLLTLTAVPCLKDPETGEVFFTPDVTAVLVSLADALEVQG